MAALASGQTSVRAGVAADVNGQAEAVVRAGDPAVLKVTVYLREGDEALLGVQEGAWPAAVSLAMRDGEGAAVEWPWRAIPAPAPAAASGPAVVLKPGGMAQAFWVLSGEQTANLIHGRYELAVTFDTEQRASERGWKGVARAGSLSVEIRGEPEAWSDEEFGARARYTAAYHALVEEWPAAISVLEAALAAKPDFVTLAGDLAECLAAAGRLDEALNTVSAAIAQFDVLYPDSDHPPFELQRVRQRVRGLIRAREAERQ
jgi:hypothetical protein